MTDSVKLRVLLGDNDSVKLILPSGIPEHLEDLELAIKRQCGVEEDFRLQYMDVEFNEYLNLTSTAELKHLCTIKVIRSTPEVPSGAHSSVPEGISSLMSNPSEDSVSIGSADTDILSSTGSTSSSSPLRAKAWPASFTIPEFTYEAELHLRNAHEEFLRNGKCLIPTPKLKSVILESLSTEILKFKAYPSSAEFDTVAEALIKKHPCLKEQGSVCGFYGWKISLKYKMANCRTSLRNVSSEFGINSLSGREGILRPARNRVKKPRKAEVNFLPDFPVGENNDSLEKERMELFTEAQKKNNHQTIRRKMDKTFALRRQEVVRDMPFIAAFKERWPALFSEQEVNL